ncbi:MAG TPA: selenoneine biosynthesis selenosugar synthase SenB [Polaromonas sp.]|uniref:selenoneine biosynthesis selenosugar synthase SenB n=1 Tax=Polaromonas sp. TaxID=1869339 RepID=UPI002D64B58E|nr:selenoneine biosynthesis selenosugar synthase SenB [Polaromonas sp.]HYW56484.1 selenoneine biosynthesis selenosugar synthase SenB [Polaromonas sp.]
MSGESIKPAPDAGDDWGGELGKASDAKTVVLVSPAMQETNNGNWHTAHRWTQFLSRHCDIALLPAWSQPLPGPPADMMIALHARRSAVSIAAWAHHYPDKPLVLVLTGTDLYRDIQGDLRAQQSLASATCLVVLQEAGVEQLPPDLRHKARVIYQSARPLRPATKSTRQFRALMVGHLRDEKDPLTYLKAAAHCSATQIRFDHIGEALQPHLDHAARDAEARLKNYRWLGGLTRALTRQHIKRAHVLVISSVMEGGAQVVMEAVQSGTAVLASRISGNLGMLGTDYAGYFPVQDDAALATLLQRCATDREFLELLEKQCRQRARLFNPARERRLVLNLLTSR